VRPTLTAIVLAACVLTGCGGSSSSESTAPKSTKVDPGPNPTTGDPGPNNTANGPQTLQGTLTARSGCVELQGKKANEPSTRYQLEFETEKVSRNGTTVVLSGSDGEHRVGPKDTIYVAGLPGSGSGPCGRIFNVEKVVAVTPAG
jgi:hypothetical protein